MTLISKRSHRQEHSIESQRNTWCCCFFVPDILKGTSYTQTSTPFFFMNSNHRKKSGSTWSSWVMKGYLWISQPVPFLIPLFIISLFPFLQNIHIYIYFCYSLTSFVLRSSQSLFLFCTSYGFETVERLELRMKI